MGKRKKTSGHQGKFPKRTPRQKGKNKIPGLTKVMKSLDMAKYLKGRNVK